MAFYDLNSCRSSGFGAGQIPWTAVNDWCNAHEIFGEQRATVQEMLKHLDLAYLQILREKDPKPTSGLKTEEK